MLRPTDLIPKYFPALIFHLVAQGWGEMQLCQINPLIPCSHVPIFPVCVLSWPGPTSLLRNTEGKGHRVLLFGFIKWQWQARFWTGPVYPGAIKLTVTAAAPWHCLKNFLFSVSTSPGPCCCLFVLLPSAWVPGLWWCSWRAGVTQGMVFCDLECRALMLARFYLT